MAPRSRKRWPLIKDLNLLFRPNLKSSSFLSRMVSVKNAVCIYACLSTASQARHWMIACMMRICRHCAYARTATNAIFLWEAAGVAARSRSLEVPVPPTTVGWTEKLCWRWLEQGRLENCTKQRGRKQSVCFHVKHIAGASICLRELILAKTKFGPPKLKNLKIFKKMHLLLFVFWYLSRGRIIECWLELSWVYRGSLCLKHRLAHFAYTVAHAADRQMCLPCMDRVDRTRFELLQFYDSQTSNSSHFSVCVNVSTKYWTP